MSEDEDWSPNGTSTDVADQSSDTFDMEVLSKPKAKRTRRTSKSKTKSPVNTTSLSSPEPEHKENMNPTSSSSSSSSARSMRARRRSSTNSTRSKNEDHSNDIDDDDDDIIVIPSKSDTTKKSQNKKRKMNETDLEQTQPVAKKPKTASSENTKNVTSKPKKKKSTKKSTEAVDRVREFMLSANRPFSASALRTEIQPEIGLAPLKKSLQSLADIGVLSMKEFGKKTKTQIYWRNQELSENNGAEAKEEESVSEIETRMASLETDLQQKRQQLNALKSETKTLEADPEDEDLQQMMSTEAQKYAALKSQLAALNADDAPTLTQEDIDAKLIEFYAFAKVWKERKEKTYEVIAAMFEESREKPDHILVNRFKGETDADNDANFENVKDMYKLAQRAYIQQNSKRRNNAK